MSLNRITIFLLTLFVMVLLMNIKRLPIEEKIHISTDRIYEETELLQRKSYKAAYKWKEIKVIATAYCSCKKCTGWGKGITASGMKPSRGTIAAPRHIPFGTIIKLDGFGEFTVQDRGGGIKEKNGVIYIDVWMPTHEEALQFGRKTMKGWIKVEQSTKANG